MSHRLTAVAAGLVLNSLSMALLAQVPPGRVEIVAVAGCLVEQSAGTWMMTRATDPVRSIANAPAAGDPYKGPTSGKNEFKLIGVTEFDMASLKDRTVLVKGLLVKDTPVSRLNLTSVTKLADSCK